MAEKLDPIMSATPYWTTMAHAANYLGGLTLSRGHHGLVRPIIEALLLRASEEPFRRATEVKMRDRTPGNINAEWFSQLSTALC